MCSGKDIIKVAAIGALGYFAGPAIMGALGGETAAAGAALGASEATALGAMSVVDPITGAIMSQTAASAAGMAGSALTAGELTALGSGAIGAGTALGSTGTQAAVAPAGEAAAGKTGFDVMGALKAGAQLAPLASLAGLAGGNPKLEAIGSPSAMPASQAAKTPAPNIFKKKLGALGDPTKASGVGGVTDLSLGKATVLGQ